MSAFFVWQVKGAKDNKFFNFLNGRFFVTGDPMAMTFGM